MAEEGAGNNFSSALSFYKETSLTSLFPLVFTAAGYFPKLRPFLTASLHYLFLERFKQTKVPLLLFSNLIQLSKGRQTIETVYLGCFDQKLQTDRHEMGAERMDVCRQDSCTLEMDASSRSVEVWVSPLDQRTD